DSAAHPPIEHVGNRGRPQAMVGGIRRYQATAGVWQVELLSAVHTVDRIYRSMRGPLERRSLRILELQRPERVWITACRVQVVSEDGVTPVSNRFTCHTNIDRPLHRDAQAVDSSRRDARLFTLSQGQMRIQFPAGFGIPLASDTELDVVMQVLNLAPLPAPIRVRHRVTFTVVRAHDSSTPLIPLYELGISALKSVETPASGQRASGHSPPGAETSEESRFGKRLWPPIDTAALCLPGRMASIIDHESDRWGRRVTGHWILPPGRETLRSSVTHMLDLQRDTTVHFMAVHLHPFAESLELFDATVGRRVFISYARGQTTFPGLRSVETFSSVEGVQIHADHEYVLNSVYNNTSGEEQDAMAVLYLYLRDRGRESVPSDGLFPELPWDSDGEPTWTAAGTN
ncbi:MAG: hypothetical protein ABGZ17_28280, partial [Planctomycetaceae bacterium]